MKGISLVIYATFLGRMANLQGWINYSSRETERKNDWEGGGKGRQKMKSLRCCFQLSMFLIVNTKFHPFQRMRFSLRLSFYYTILFLGVSIPNTHV